jgi:lipoprotein-releasing system permease protein
MTSQRTSKVGKNFSLYIAKRIRARNGTNFSSLISKIAIGSIATGIAVMIISFAIFQGYTTAIQEKIFSFSGHIRASKNVTNNSYEDFPVSLTYYLYAHALEIPGIKHIQLYSQKPGMLKTDNEIMGVVMKGIGRDFDPALFEPNLEEGTLPDLSGEQYTHDVVLSRKIANKLLLNLHDSVSMYFLQDPPRVRKLRVCGIYNTGIEEFDHLLIVGDNRLIQRLNNWADSLVGGFEIYIEDFSKIDEVFEVVWEEMDFELGIMKVTDRYVQFFDWFIMLNRNVFVFLFVILFVACFNIVSITLIMIMERTNMIGLLKALGATNQQVRKIFIFNGYRMLWRGLLIGNAIGLTFCWLQGKFKLIPLNQENYYMDAVPILIDPWIVLLLNVTLVVLVMMILLFPTFVISRIEPIRAIKFD